MPLVNRQPFKPSPIPENLGPDDEVFYHELTNEIFTTYDAYFDRFLYCNSLIWTCSRTGKHGLTYKEALDSENAQGSVKKKKRKTPSSDETQSHDRDNNSINTSTASPTKSTNESAGRTSSTSPNEDGSDPPVKKKKKKYPYDPKKYSMPVPDGFDPNLLTPTGKIDGRKLKSKKNRELAEELLAKSNYVEKSKSSPGKRGKQKAKDEETRKKEDEVKKKENEAKKKAQLQAELARDRELEAKRKKEAAALTRQLERQKREEERKKAAAFLQNWEKKCEDLERDDLKRLPQPTPVNCNIPEQLFGDAVYIMEAIYNFHDLYGFNQIYPDGLNFDTLEEILTDKQEDGPLGTLLQFLLRVIFDTQPSKDGYGLDDDPTKPLPTHQDATENLNIKQETKVIISKPNDNHEGDEGVECEANGVNSDGSDDENDENEDKAYVNMNDRIGSAIKAAQEVRKSLTKPLPKMEIDSSNVTEIIRLHLIQSGSFPKGRTIYNGWYSSREDPGLWLCMQEPELIKRLGESKVYELDLEDRIKIIHTLIYQLLTFIKSRTFMEMASDQLTELRKEYRQKAADFARWDRENCVKRMQPPKKKSDASTERSITDHDNTKTTFSHRQSDDNVNDDRSEDSQAHNDQESSICEGNNQQLKSCLKTNGSGVLDGSMNGNDELTQSKKKITFSTGLNGAIEDNSGPNGVNEVGEERTDDSERTFEEIERDYQQNTVDYEDYQRERAIRLEQLNETLLDIRVNLRNNQAIYAVHPIGRDRAYRRYWLFQSLPGLFVEQDDEYVGKCLPNPTPLESRYKKLFNKDNPLMHQNEADLIRPKMRDVACSTDTDNTSNSNAKSVPVKQETNIKEEHKDNNNPEEKDAEMRLDEESANKLEDQIPNRLNGDAYEGSDHNGDSNEQCDFTADEMNICTGDEATCCIHGQRHPTQPRWWFYNQPETIDRLIECLNKRGYRESELHDILSAENSIIKSRATECPAYKLYREILEQAGIRRSRRLRTKGSKRRPRNYD